MAEPATPSDSVQVGFAVSWEVEVDDDVDGLDVDSSCAEIRTYKASAFPLSKPMKNMIPFLLTHLSMNKVTGITKLHDLLRQQLHPHRRITEYDGLRDVQLTKQRVEAMDLVFLIDVAVILGYTFERQFIHYIHSLAAF